MNPARRRFLQLAAGAAALPVGSRAVRAQAYPTRPVRLVVAAAPGSTPDILARLMAHWLPERIGQPCVVENRPGGGTNIGTEAVVKATPDGHTLLLVSTANAINATLFDKLSFTFIRDIAPVAGISRQALVMVVDPSFPARTIPELVAYAKAHPGRINIASAGIASAPYMACELFKMMAGVDMIHVPYRGGAAALTELLGGQVPTMFGSIAGSLKYIRSGKLRPLAVTSSKRLEVLPDVPTVGEFVPGYEATGFYGVGAPGNTPAGIVAKLNQALNAGLADSTIKARLAELDGAALPGSPAQFGRLIAEETEKWARVIKFAGIKPE